MAERLLRAHVKTTQWINDNPDEAKRLVNQGIKDVSGAVILGDRVLVMTPPPGRLKHEIRIDLPRPRGPDSHAVVDLAARVRSELEHDIYAVPAAEDAYAI